MVSGPAHNGSMQKMTHRILIIDDQPDSVGLLMACLEGQALDILVALDGMDGLNKAMQGLPDLILLDVDMPGIDGFAVCRQLKAAPETAAIPVIFLSACAALDHKLQGFALGAVDYVTKPFSEAEVLARVEVHVHAEKNRKLSKHWKEVVAERVLHAMQDPRRNNVQLFERAVKLLESHMDAPPGLTDLALQLGTNPRKLNEIFRQRVGMTVFDYFTELRLETACRLLEDSTIQIQLISDRIGYSNSGDFTRAFRRRYGVSPRAYRQARYASHKKPIT